MGLLKPTLPGSEGLFAAIQSRGNVEVGFTAAAGLDEFDAILKNLDTQGAIEENMLFLQRQTSLDFDDMLAASLVDSPVELLLVYLKTQKKWL